MVLIEIPLIVEQTSSSESHYELMALAGILSEIRGDLQVIRTLMEQSFAVSELMRLEAQRILDAHAQSAQDYLRQIDEPVPVDYYPFQLMPAGTTVRDLPDGGRLFGFTDGAFLRVLPDGEMVSIGEDGMALPLAAAAGGMVRLPDGRELTLVSDAIQVTHESAGIGGLPDGVEPVLASAGRYSVALPGGVRLDVSHKDRIASVINPTGTIVVLGIARIEGVGEDVLVHAISGGAKSFRSQESGHAGMIEADGTIHLSLSNGLDLAIRLSDSSSGGADDDHGATCFNCVEPD